MQQDTHPKAAAARIGGFIACSIRTLVPQGALLVLMATAFVRGHNGLTHAPAYARLRQPHLPNHRRIGMPASTPVWSSEGLCPPTAAVLVTAPLASGRDAVRATFLSRSASHRSFTVQPAPRSSSAPAPKRVNSCKFGKAPGGAASAMDQKHGHASSQVPAKNSGRDSH